MIDVIIPAVLRPAMLDVTLASLETRLLGNLESFRLLVNVDPVGHAPDDLDDRAKLSAEVEAVCRRYCKRAVVNFPESGSLNEALRWLWSNVESEFCLYWEDDIVAVRPVPFPAMVRTMQARENLAFLNVPDRSFVEGRESDHNLTHEYLGEGLYRRTGKYKMTLQPGLLRREFVHELARLIKPSPDPEIQFHTDPTTKAFVDQWEFATVARPGVERAVVDVGFNARVSDGWTKLVLPTGTTWAPERTIERGDFSARIPELDITRDNIRQVNEGKWRPDSFNVMDRFLRPGMQVVDVGAWIGVLSLYAAHKGCDVLAVEPDPVAYDVLAQVLNRNLPLSKRITPTEKAVTDGTARKLGAHGGAFGTSRSSLLLGDSETAVAVRCYTFAQLLQHHGIGRADYVKLIVQGLEPEILANAVPSFGNDLPTLNVSVQPHFYADRASGLAMLAAALAPYRHITTEKGVPIDVAAVPDGVGEVIIVATNEEWGE